MRLKSILSHLTLLAILLVTNNCGKKNEDILCNKKYINEIKEARDKAILFMATNQVPGASFAVSVNGELVYSEGLGLASKDLEVPAGRETKYRIGQVSELFTSHIYQLMVEEGTLHPDSIVQYYLPDYPKTNYNISLKHLVNHASGIREAQRTEKNWRGLNITLQQGLQQFKNDSLIVPPGEMQIPSLYNYNLLGAIMEKAIGKNFYEILEKYVTDILHLENTVIDHPFITIKNRSDYYDYNYIMQVINATFRDMRYRGPSEGILSTAEELVKFGNALLFSENIPENVKKIMFEPMKLSNGSMTKMVNGWMMLQPRDGKIFYGKSGSVTGGSAAILVYPEQKIVVSCACNLSVNQENLPVFDLAKPFLSDSDTGSKK